MIKTTFSASDIECGGCASAIEKVLSPVEGIGQVRVDVEQKTVTVEYDPVLVSVEALLTRLDHTGFPATPLQN